jgi:amino acid adenylation domain-containing protein
VVFEDQYLTYAELNARANQLAHSLCSQGVGPDVLVGICVERSLEMIVGLLGILKAGGAYLPLDPAYPEKHLAYVLQDARPAVLLTQQRLQSILPVTGFCLDSQWDVLDGCARSNPDNITLPDNLAYVIYTSGSTGKPKGTGIAHRSAVNLQEALLDKVYRNLGEISGLRVGLNASISFDASVKQWLLLLHGVRLYLIPDRIRADVNLLAAAIGDWHLDVMDCTPSQLSILLPASSAAQLPKCLLIGGEAIDPQLWRDLQGHPNHRFYNMYGPTEATVDTVIGDIHTLGNLPALGCPIGNVQVYILDARLNAVPIGVAGELCIAGAGLARGYLNRPEQTAGKFVPNPFSAEPGARMYRTGDLARWLPDGNLEFLGRIDHQVKIRGFRIELGEIEAALAALPEVREVVVLAREDIPGDKRLAAYLTPQPGRALPETAELRSRLSQSLPEYMLPAHFIPLAQLPLTPNGKIDRKALPAPDVTRSEFGYVAPRTPTEETLAQIWAEVLKLDRVGIHDNFFELGGHSLLAVHLMARIQQTFQCQIPLSGLFQNPTLAQFAVLIAERTTPPWSPIVPIQPQGSQTPLFCIHPAGGFASDYADLAHRLGTDQPLYGLQARGLDEQQSPHTSIEEMAACYREAIQQVQAQGPYFLAGWSLGGIIAYEISQQLKQQGEEIAFLGLLDSHILSDASEPDGNSVLISYLRQAGQSIEHLEQMISETDDDIVPKAFAIAKKAELMPPDFQLADFQRILDVYKAHSHATFTYQPQSYPGKVTLFVCQEPPENGVAATRANIDRWSGLAHSLEVREIPGNHFTLMDPPHVDYLATEISGCLRRVMDFHKI